MRRTSGRLGRWAGSAGCVLLLAWGMLGCTGQGSDTDGPSPGPGEEEQVQVEESRSQVEQSLREAADAIRSAGFELPEARGRWVGCGMESTSGVEYSAGGVVTGGGPQSVDRVVAIRDALVEVGWELLGESTTPVPAASMQRDGLQLSLAEDRREPGTVTLAVRGECVRFGDETDRSLIGKRPAVEL